MTDHGHHHKHSHGHHHGCDMHGHGNGMLNALFGSAPGLSSLGRNLGDGKNFWLGAAIGAAVVAVVSSPDARSALSSIFRGSSAAPQASPHGEGNATPAPEDR